MSDLLTGTINGFRGGWGSGLGALIVDGVPVHCENAPTVRSWEGCFGNVIDDNHCVNQDAIVGKRISYSVDCVGFLEGFSPIEEGGEL